jgi:hypothetical protein
LATNSCDDSAYLPTIDNHQSTVDHSNPALSATTFDDVDGLVVSVDVTNTGDVAGKEIAPDHEAA